MKLRYVYFTHTLCGYLWISIHPRPCFIGSQWDLPDALIPLVCHLTIEDTCMRHGARQGSADPLHLSHCS